jgi:uncharacterized protein (TIGR02246 family)
LIRRVAASAFLTLALALRVQAQAAPDADALRRLLDEFLAGASRNDAAAHERFWADDLVYTGSAGRRIGKADILADVRKAPAPPPGSPTTTFTAADVRIQPYGDAAVVAFRLVGTTEDAGRTTVANYFNTGTFVKRDGRWQAVSWQATRVPPRAEDARKEAEEAQSALQKAVVGGDAKALGALLDDGFVWTRRTGERVTRADVLAQVGSGKLRPPKLEPTDVSVSVHGETAVLRGASAAPLAAFYTLTLVRQDGVWKAVALHTSR